MLLFLKNTGAFQMASIASQLSAISKIMSKPKPCPEYKFTFGQYRGQWLEEILEIDKKYLHWLLSEDFINDKARKCISQALGVEID
jgi:uncharacterized protein (DUF3820 family)